MKLCIWMMVAKVARWLAPSRDVGPELILIPAGEFLMGSDPEQDQDAYEDEQPQHRVYLPDYYIAKTPTTNVQYAAFVNATGHPAPRHWRNGKPPQGKARHPVVNVSWQDALAYCRWLSEATGKPYTLPNEAEWEKAARGTDGRLYPWGDDAPNTQLCNFNRNVGDTTPVGHYSPQGASPYGCLDMAGNVWEWTRSLWGLEPSKPEYGYPYDPDDGREDERAGGPRVLRGGSFISSYWGARCAYRYNAVPSGLSGSGGFRVVCPTTMK